MRKLRYILLILVLCPALLWAQKRYNPADQWEYRLAELSGFSSRNIGGQPDARFGLHTSLYTGARHLVGFSVDAGWSAMVSNMAVTHGLPGGASAGIHFVYEYQNSGYLLQTGLGLSYQKVTNAIADTSFYTKMVDNWGGTTPLDFTLRHRFTDRRDESQLYYARIPVYVGHYIPGALGMGYFLAGVQVQYAFGGNTHVTMVGSTAGQYDRFDGIWDEMDSRGYRKDVPIDRTGDRLKINFDLLAHGEIGYEYATSQNVFNYRKRSRNNYDCRFRFAAFFDMSVLDIGPKTDNPFYEMPTATIFDFPTYRMYHVYSSVAAKESWVRNLSVGIRVSVFFGFEGKERVILGTPWRR